MGVLQGPDSCPDLSITSYDNIFSYLWISCGFEHLRMLEVQNESNVILWSCSVNVGGGFGEGFFWCVFWYFVFF